MATTNIQSFSGKIEVNGTTPSSSKITGALTVAGGVGVTSNIHASNLFASDYVAIGTTSPGQKLEVGHYGGALSSDLGAIRITNHATNLHATSLARFDISLGDIGSNTGSGKRKLIFNSKTTTTDSGTDILCLDGQTNNVGIGKASPTSRLDVSDLSNSKTTPTLTLNHSGVFDYADPQPSVWQSIDFTTEASGTRTRQCGINLLNYSSAGTGQNGIADRLRTGLGFSVHNENGMVENALVINKDGSVGIGTTNPGTPLHVLVPDIGNTTEVLRLENGDGTGDIVSTSGGFIGMHLRDNNVGGGEVARISWKHDGTDSSTEGLGQLGFWTSNTGGSGPGVPVERMTIRANGNVGIGTASPTAQLTLGASSGSQIAVTDNTRLLSNTHYLSYGSDVATDFEQVLLQFYTGGTNDTDQSEYAGYIDVEMVAQRTQSLYYSEIFTARLNYILAWNEQNDSWEITTFVQENKSVSAGVPNSFTVFKSVPVFKYKYVDRQLQIYVSFNANYFRGYTSFTARVTSDAPADVSMPGPDALMASGTVGTAEIGMCYGYGANAAYVGVGTDSPVSILHVRGTGQTSTTSFDTSQTLGASIFVQSSDSTVGSGGSLVLGTYQGKFAAIKAGILDGTNNTMGNLHFMTRNATADATLTNRMTITNTGNVGIGVTNPTRSLQIERGISYISGGTSNNSAFEIVQQLGTDDYTFKGQHRAQFRIKSGLGTYSNRSLELALLDNGRGIMQASAASEGYFPISINPKGDYNSTVSIGSYSSGAKLHVQGNVYATSDIITAGNVGIGSYSPGTKLDVAGVSRFTQNGGNLQLVGTDHTYLEYYPDGTSAGRKAYVGYASADDNNFTISNSAGSGHIVLGSGNVGIAVSQDPFTKLTIGSSASADGDIDEIGFRSINNTANDRIGYIQRIGFYGKAEYSNTPILNGAIECLFGDNQHYPTYPGHSSTNLIFKTNSRGGGTGIEKMRITYDGRLGLGTTNPNQGNLTVSALGADPYFTGYDENAAADATDFTGLAHFKSTGSHGVIRISNNADKTGSTRIDFNTRLGDLWGVNTLSNSLYRGTAPTAGRIMVSGETDNNYEDSYMTFHTCRDLRPDGVGGTGNLYERMRITSTGRVGIGVSPSYPLHVAGSAGNMPSMKYFNSASTALQSGVNDAITIYAAGNIYASGLVAASDERIKKDIVDADDAECLEVLRLLKPKKYKYKDKINRGTEPVWGFIAQEVRETLQYATQLRQDVLPNIYELANVSQSNVITFVNFNTSNLESNATTLIRTNGIDGQDHDIHLAEVIDEHSIRVEEDLTTWTGSVDETGNVITEITVTTITPEEYEALEDTSGYDANITGYQNANVVISVEEYNALEDTSGYEEIIDNYTRTTTTYPGTQLFVYGQEVDDFVFIKKEAIWTVATSALQEVDRQLQAEKAKVATLESQLTSVLARLDALEGA
jgi:hypothetical protein